MSTPTARLADADQDDDSRVPTPTATFHPSQTPSSDFSPAVSINPKDLLPALSDTDSFSAALSAMLSPPQPDPDPDASPTPPQPHPPEQPSNSRLLPLPTPTANRSRTSFAFPDSNQEDAFVSLDELPAEVATADISIAPDGSFVETSSGAAARELKRRYDRFLGVGKDVRSPYAITAFVNQHGKQMYRVGAREMSAPAAAAPLQDIDIAPSGTKSSAPSASTSASQPPQHGSKRRSRMSVHSFLPTMFGSANVTQPLHSPPPSKTSFTPEDGTRSPPSRKLRKTRSIPNLPGAESSTAPAPQPPAPTGRPHAHSVSSADAFRVNIPPPPPLPQTPVSEFPTKPPHDIFSEVLTWSSTVPPSPYSSHSGLLPPSNRASSSIHDSNSEYVPNPFGKGVTFDSPSWLSPSHLSTPPQLREMQSFESGLTARADPQSRGARLGKLRARLSDLSDDPSSPVDQQPQLFSSPDHPIELESENPVMPEIRPSVEPSMVSRYSTDLFDVLQNYRGLPVPEKLSPLSHETTIRLSLKSDETAAPRDDPRFVIWGEVEADERDDLSLNLTDFSSGGHSGMSRRRSSKRHTVAVEQPFVRVSSGEGPKKVIVAATIERWIAQLTSELNYDELLLFFLTYRTYISALDLGHLLICRFHWTLAQVDEGSHDQMVRRIVRVRTFIAIRYWLLTFFNVDFVPNRELRLLFADWLNSLRKDPIVAQMKDAESIVRKLRKVVLDCKDAHIRKTGRYAARASADKSHRPQAQVPTLGDLSDGHFADSMRIAFGMDVDGDVDLDFEDTEETGDAGFGVDTDAQAKNVSNPIDLAKLRQPLHLAFLHLNQTSSAVATPVPTTAITGPIPLPVAHSTLSRMLVNTMGRLGRWKRVLHNRGPARAPMATCVDASAFDIDSSDLLQVKGGVEQYLRAFESRLSQTELTTSVPPPTPPKPTATASQPLPSTSQSSILPPLPEPPGYDKRTSTAPSVPETNGSLAPNGDTTEDSLSPNAGQISPVRSLSVPDLTRGTPSPISSRSLLSHSIRSRGSIDSASSRPRGRWQMDIVSIDDLDLSDLSSTEDLEKDLPRPPGLRKLPRRLPNRRDFEFVRHSDSVSSLGVGGGMQRESVMSTGSGSVASGPTSTVPELGAVQQWQVDALVDSLSDEEDDGDAEAALRRLEGQISHEKQRAKESKVDGWVQSIRERLAAGQFGAERTRASMDSDEEDYGEVKNEPETPISRSSASRISTHMSPRSSISSVVSPQSPSTPAVEAVQQEVAPSTPAAQVVVEPAPPTAEVKPSVEEVVPPEILQSRVSRKSISTTGSPPSLSIPPEYNPRHFVGRPVSRNIDKLNRHISFVMGYRSESLVQHFSMIDRELFIGLNFEEIVSQNWATSAEDANVLNWIDFLRERAQLKAEGRHTSKTSCLTLARGRFNLMANFVISEIVLTHPSERTAVKAKFIRMAWKAYGLKSYNLLVALIAGLRSEWVAKAMKQAVGRVGIWETRLLEDLIAWTTSEGDFKFIRQTVDAMGDVKSIPNSGQESSVMSDGQSTTSRSRAASDIKPPPPPPACIPFFGVYLSCLQGYSALPDLIDPTAPHEAVIIDPETNTFESPAHPEVFSNLVPLPPTVQLEPLINVQKQRLIAEVVKSLVAGQHLAARVQFPTDRKLFQQCLKLRGLDTDTLQRALALYPS